MPGLRRLRVNSSTISGRSSGTWRAGAKWASLVGAARDRSWNVVLDDVYDPYDKTVAIGPQPTPTQAGADSVVSIPEKQSA
jgi:hypothetical protein